MEEKDIFSYEQPLLEEAHFGTFSANSSAPVNDDDPNEDNQI